jgi:hypothetical protein
VHELHLVVVQIEILKTMRPLEKLNDSYEMFNFDLDWSVLSIWNYLPTQLEKGQSLSKNFEGGRIVPL